MNFEGQSKSDYLDHTQVALDAFVGQTIGSQGRETTRFGFKATDFIVYPAHGIGQITIFVNRYNVGFHDLKRLCYGHFS